MIKTREFKEHNYRAVWFNGKTIRMAIDPKKAITELKYPEFYDIKLNSYCEGSCSWCLPGDSKISTINGEKFIKDIEKGDVIFNMNLKKHKLSIGEVEQTYERQYDGDLIEIELENGNVLSITPSHKVYTLNRGYVEASELLEGDDIFFLT